MFLQEWKPSAEYVLTWSMTCIARVWHRSLLMAGDVPQEESQSLLASPNGALGTNSRFPDSNHQEGARIRFSTTAARL